MSSIDIVIWLNAERSFSFSSFLACDKLEFSRKQLVEIQILLHVLQEYVLRMLKNDPSKTGEPKTVDCREPTTPGETEVSSDETAKFLQPLEDTAKNITTAGPQLSAWLGTDRRRQLQLQSTVAKSLETYIEKGSHDLEPIVSRRSPSARRNQADSILWLINNYVGSAHALLVICSYSSRSLEKFTKEMLISMLVYLIRHQELLRCEALEIKARFLRE